MWKNETKTYSKADFFSIPMLLPDSMTGCRWRHNLKQGLCGWKTGWHQRLNCQVFLSQISAFCLIESGVCWDSYQSLPCMFYWPLPPKKKSSKKKKNQFYVLIYSFQMFPWCICFLFIYLFFYQHSYYNKWCIDQHFCMCIGLRQLCWDFRSIGPLKSFQTIQVNKRRQKT